MRAISLAPALLLLALAACGGKDCCTVPDNGPAWDLAFAGEVAGTQTLLRTRGAPRTVQRIGLGYPGTGVAPVPAGDRLVFTSLGTSSEPPRLMVLDGGEGEPRPFVDATDSYEREADWSPTGDRLAFTALRDEGFGDVFVASVVADRFVSMVNLTATNGGAGAPDMTPAWSPTGTRIAFTSYRAGNPSIWVMNADGTEPRQLTPAGDWGDYFPTWSPQGDSIAFQRLDGASARIGLVAASGGTPRFLTLPGDAYSPAWAPDAARLAITMRVEAEDLDLHVIGTEGTIVERIRRPGRDYQPAWVRREAKF